MADDQGQAGGIMRYSFLHVFANDGVIDAGELAFMERLALQDQIVDAQERIVLGHIFDRVNPDTVSPDVRTEIESFRRRFGI